MTAFYNFWTQKADKYLLNYLSMSKHRWFSGRIIAFQAVDPGSIPGRCIFFNISSTMNR